MSIFAEYPYLWATMTAIVILLPLTAIQRRHGRTLLFSGLILAPTGLFAYSFDDYWAPLRLGSLPSGIEDVAFCFASGLAAWLIVLASPFARRLSLDWHARRIAFRVGGIALVIPAFYFLLLGLGANPMTALLAGLMAAASVALVHRPTLWPLTIPGALGYPVLHVSATALAARVWPDLFSVWNPDHLWGASVLIGIPLGEVVWAAVFGACWPPVVAMFLDAKPR